MATMPEPGNPARALSTRELIGEIAGKATRLIKTEAELAKAELKADLQSELAMAKGFAVALVCALLGLNTLLVALVFGLTVWMPGWLAALIMGGVMLGLAAIIGFISWSRRVTPLAATRKSLQEDLQWAKERLA